MAALIVGDLASLDLSVAVIAKMGFEGALNSVKRKRATTEKESFTQRMKMGQDSNIKAAMVYSGYIFNYFMPLFAAYRGSQ